MSEIENRQPHNSVADDNVERLITGSYRPETPDAAFVTRVEQALLATARQVQADRQNAPAIGTAGSGENLPLALKPWQIFAGWAAAIALLIAVILTANLRPQKQRLPYYRDGDMAWIDGQPYIAQNSAPGGLPSDNLRPLDATLAKFERERLQYDTVRAIVARARPEPAKPPAVAVGDSIRTQANERRRVTLPDGSVLYVNQNTELKLASPSRVELARGEMFVEVAPRDSADAKFVVGTPDRQVTALGTKFAVTASEKKSRVLVTQGKVQLSDIEAPLSAGRQAVFSDEDVIIEQAPRADHELDWMRELVAAAEGALIPANDKAGGALFAVDPDGQDAKLSLRKYHVDVHIEDGFARTTIDQTYFNHMYSRLEGTFYFPLPPDASLSRLAMYVGGKLMEGGMAERDYARQVFETIKHRQLDPALLEWVDGSTFKMRVFPLEARQQKRIILSYTQKLDISYGRARYRFPAGHNMKVAGDWSTHVRVKNGARLLWDSPSHELTAAKDAGDLILTAQAKLDRLNRDLVVHLSDDSIAQSRPAVPDGQGSGKGKFLLSTTTHEDAHYLMLRWRPELPTEPARENRNWIFLFESSADRHPLLARTQIEIIRTVLNHAEHDDTFSIVSAGAYTHSFSDQPLAASRENISKAMEFLDHTHLVGALDLGHAFAGLKPFVEEAENPVIVHVGSSVPVLGEREANRLVQTLPAGAQYVGVGVGKRFNRSLMKLAAARTGGYFTQINPDESTSWRGFELVSTLNTPRLLDVKVETDSGACQMLTLADSLAHGDELCAIGQYEKPGDAPKQLTVTGQLNGKAFTQKLSVNKNTLARSVSEGSRDSTSPLPRMWAKQQIELLTSLGAEQHKDRIIALSKAMYVMSPFTSLLVLENEEMYEQYKIDRGRKDHWAIYPAPERIDVEREEGRGVRVEGREKAEEGAGDDNARLADDGSSSKKKPSVVDVLDTILVHRPAPILSHGGYFGSHTTTVLQALDYAYAWPFETVNTTVTAPDGGTVLISGQEFSTSGVPVLSKIPYVNRLFHDVGIGGDTQSLMMMVTPRIIIQEEDEELLGIGRFGVLADGTLRAHEGTTGLALLPFSGTTQLEQFPQPQGSLFLQRYKRGLGRGATEADFDSLIDLITSTVRPETWEGVGGSGVIEAFPGNLSLVISQTQDVYDTPPVRLIDNSQSMTALDWTARNASDGYLEYIEGSPQLGPITYPDPRMWEVLVRPRRKYTGDFSERAYPVMDLVLPIAEYQFNDIRNFAPGPEFRLARNAPPMALRVPRQRVPPWEIEPTAATLQKVNGLVEEILDPEITINVSPDKPRRITTKRPFTAFSITNPAVVGAVRLGAKEFELVGRSLGITTMTLWYPGEGEEPEIIRYLVRVAEDDGDDLSDQQRELFLQMLRAKQDRQREMLVAYVAGRVNGNIGHPDVLYQRPQFSGNNEIFRRLTSYAPGLNTSWADVQAILEAEADVPSPVRGKVDVGAKRLIDRARALGWQSIEWQDDDGKATFSLTANGSGQFRYERRTRHGLAETVICDGKTLRHHYPEIGLGATRELSRFHRRALAAMVPWAVLPAADLAIGADVRLINANTIGIVPLGAEGLRGYVELQMTFADDGRLAERRLVAQPDRRTLVRVTYARGGMVRCLDSEGTEFFKQVISAKNSAVPNIAPDESQLVVLPMPARTRAHALRTADADFSEGLKFTDLSEEDALRVLAANVHYDYSRESVRVIGQRFFSRGDRRLGFYTIMLSGGNYWDPAKPTDIGWDQKLLCNPQKDHPNSPLAAYIASQLHYEDVGDKEFPPKVDGPQDGFIQQLAELRRQQVVWSKGRLHNDGGDPFSNEPQAENAETFDFAKSIEFIERLHSPEFRWVMLGYLQGPRNIRNQQRRYADAYERLENDPVLGYLARYEHARALYGTGEHEASRKLFTQWYEDTLAAGALPRIDSGFFEAIDNHQGDPFGGRHGGEDWNKLMRDTARKFVEQGRRPTALTLAWQCRQLDAGDSANQLFAIAMTGVGETDRFAMTLAGVEYLSATGEQKRALALVEPLLADEETSQLSSLWRLGSTLAQQQGMTARSAKMLEQALAIEYGKLQPEDVVNLEQLRSDYGELLGRYRQLATAMAALEERPSPELLSRLIGAADRWRGMEDDVTQPCHRVARIFSLLGADQLAWQYVTTPLAARPNEAAPWLELAASMKSKGNYAMADRAYREAFRAEGSNAEILWEHAQLLSESGRFEAARQIYEQIAAGDWQPRFRHVQEQAKQIVGRQ